MEMGMQLKAQDTVVDPDEGVVDPDEGDLVVGIREKGATTVARSDILLVPAGHRVVEQRDKGRVEEILGQLREGITFRVWMRQASATHHVLVNLESASFPVELK